MLAKLKEYIVVCILNKEPLPDLETRRLKERIAAAKPDYWEEYEPGVFLAFFLIKRGGRTKSVKLSASVRVMKGVGTPYENMGVEKAVGELVTESTWYGRILTCPFGDAVNQAIRKAREDSERGFSLPSRNDEEEKG